MPSVLVGVLALAAAPVDGGDAAAQGRLARGLAGVANGRAVMNTWEEGKVNYFVDTYTLERTFIEKYITDKDGPLLAWVPWAVQHMEARTCIRMTQCATEAGCAKPYIKFTGGAPWPLDCSSPAGLDVSKVNEVFITGCAGKRAVVHEILHSLGLAHEHQRTDRDEYLNGLSDEGMGKKEGQYSQNLGPYDFKSIMHYSLATLGLTAEANPQIENFEEVGKQEGMSPGDAAAVDYMYNSCSKTFARPRCIASKDEARVLRIESGRAFRVEFYGLYDLSCVVSYLDGTAPQARVDYSDPEGRGMWKVGHRVLTFVPSEDDVGQTFVLAARFTARFESEKSCLSKVTVEVVQGGPTPAPPTPAPCVDVEAWCPSRAGWCDEFKSVSDACPLTCGVCEPPTEPPTPPPTTVTPAPTAATPAPTTPSPPCVDFSMSYCGGRQSLCGISSFAAECPVTCDMCGDAPDTPQPTAATPQPTTETPQPTTETPQPTTETPQPTTETPQPTTVTPPPSCKDFSESYCGGRSHYCSISGFATDCPVTCGVCA
eukprot:TRINITY_DN3179_c0_g3_i1.p1 TRINITY_DN3179_c0_g3~~TRINITY_DN3179_c0_g3_i1.p1  ORF type:complete len:542 (+),score=162.63 TRINITY_DN3179_c0_g3_i1:46-1671(+)